MMHAKGRFASTTGPCEEFPMFTLLISDPIQSNKGYKPIQRFKKTAQGSLVLEASFHP